MASGGPPDSLSSRHYQIAGLDAAGYTNVEIAGILSINANRISMVKASPLYQALIAAERRKLLERAREGWNEKLNALTEKAWDAKDYLLDQRDNLSVLNAASDSILDRVVPKKTEHEEKREVIVRLTVEDEARIRRTLDEDPPSPPPNLTPLIEAMAEVIEETDAD